MIDIVKASAGSGKTFHLAKTYISLLLSSQEANPYRHILAVTFTNKATDEMKSRILKELDILARTPEESPYYKEFSQSFGNAAQISSKAENLLFNILHDYGAFSVSTIDKFFQMTLKSFAREIGQFSTYQIELDKDSLVRESVDRLLDGLDESEKGLLNWLTDSAMTLLEEGSRADITDGLYEMAKALKSDAHREIIEKYGIDEAKAYSKENLKAVKTACRKYRKAFSEKLKDVAQRVVDGFERAGLRLEDTSRSCAVTFRKYQNAGPDDIQMPSESFMDKVHNPEKWLKKADIPKYLSSLEESLAGPMQEFADIFEGEDFILYNTAKILEKQIYNLGVAAEINKSFDSLMKEKNVMNLDDSNVILRRIIGETDTPFIYEKLGVRYTNFLLDEFQDTSTIQWENFRPLVGESSDNGNYNLIVGDVKQSIYRWRGSDWKLLDSQVKQEFPYADDTKTLSSNWRSLPEIVSFNNGFFKYAAQELDTKFGEKLKLSRIYRDVVQDIKCKGQGMLDFSFCTDDETQMEKILESIRNVHAGGADYGQIAVLVRTNGIGAEVASYLIKEKIPVISDDSLDVKSSLTVRRLASLLHYVENPENTADSFLAKDLNIDCPKSYLSILDLAEGLLRGLVKADADSVDAEVLYVQSFMDEIQDWTSINGNNLSAFLKHWDESNPVISSPQDPNAVRVITVHKAKGLQFPYVIFPFAESVEFSRNGSYWCVPELSGTELDTGVPNAYHVLLSDKSSETLFAKDFEREKNLQVADNLNIFYVALTRAEKGLHVIAQAPDKKMRAMSDILYKYLSDHREEYVLSSETRTTDEGKEADGIETSREETAEKKSKEIEAAGEKAEQRLENFHKGEMPDFAPDTSGDSKKKGQPEDIELSYPCFPERGKQIISTESDGFFSDTMSPRREGTVLHDILSDVLVPSDLGEAVARRVRHGDISQSEAERYRDLLEERLSQAKDLGWFPEDRSMVENELSIVDTEGRLHRTDRVVISGDSVMIIDYKFGEEQEKYLRQIEGYARLYRAMGYKEVKACLWYVYENKIVYLHDNK